MKIKKTIEKLAIWLLVLSLTTTLLPMSTRAEESGQNRPGQESGQQTETMTGNNAPEDEVTLIVELEKQPQENSRFSSLFSTRGNIKDRVKNQIKNLVNPSPRNFSNLFGLLDTDSSENKLDVVYDYDKVMSGFAVKVKSQYLKDIQKIEGVKNAFIENTYSVPETQKSDIVFKNSDVLDMIGAKNSQYTGKGMLIAIIDTGLFTSHEAFVEEGVEDTLTQEKISSFAKNLKAANGELDASQARVNKKIPFAYDYADGDYDVNPSTAEASDHGTHVTGIAAANGGDTVRGVAPDAQIALLKVFSNGSGSASDSNIIAALEDTLILGADVVNMSLGADSGFSTAASDTYQDIYDSVKDAGIVLSIAAGNSSNSTYGNSAGNNLPKVTEPDDSIVASPASYNASFAVASSTGANQADYFMAEDKKIRFLEATKEGDKFKDLTGEQQFVDCKDGSPKAIEEALKREGLLSLEGRIALVERGGKTEDGKNLTFAMKADIAQANGASGLIVYDNVDNNGLIDMGGIMQSFPAAYISKSDGQILINLKSKKIIFDKSYVMKAPAELSTFSSWGPTPDLKLKPEITAPGGNIYSTAPNNAYETMSGTSMAAPQISGITAAVKQYINSNEKLFSSYNGNKNDLITALIMSTATPVRQGDTWYSPRKQGAGLANLSDAVNAKAYLTVKNSEASKPKAELGAGTDSRKFTFTVHNVTDEKLSYAIDTAALSQTIKDGFFQQATINYTGKGIDVSYQGLTDGKVIVEPGSDADIEVTIAFGEEFKNAIAQAVNGTYVDGFVQMTAGEGSGSNLSIPFLAFYGNLENAPVFDGTELDGPYSMGQSRVYSTSTGKVLGQNAFDETIGVNPERYVVSTKGLYGEVLGLRTQTYLLRNVDKLQYRVTEQKTGKTIMSKDYNQVRKSTYNAAAGVVTYAEALVEDAPQFKGYDEEGNKVPEGWYTYTITATIPGTENKTQEWSFEFYYDESEPVIESSEVIEENGKKIWRLKFSDKHYVSGVNINADRDKQYEGDSVLVEQKVYTDPDNAAEKKADKNIDSTYTLDLDYETVVKKLQEQNAPDDHVVVFIYDYGLNYVSEKIYLREIFPESVSLNKTELTLTRGEEAELTASILPENTNKRKIEFISENPEIASVDQSGKVTAKSAGKTKILVKTEDKNVTASCEVTVNEIAADAGIVLSRKTADMYIAGDSVTLIATLGNNISGEVSWSSSDPDIVSVENGVLTAKKIGDVKITASVISQGKEYTAICDVSSRVKPNDQFEIDEKGVLTKVYGDGMDIHIPEGVTEIADNTFYNLNIQSVTIPASVKRIGERAFGDCYNLGSYEIGEGSNLESIGAYAFSGTMLTSVTLPDSLKSIGEGAFYNSVGNMTYPSVKIPKGVTQIPANAFSSNYYLNQIELHDGITSIGNEAFAYSALLKEIHVPDALREIGDNAFAGTSLTSFTAPKGLKKIGNRAFIEVPLTEVNLNEGLESIGAQAFSSIAAKSFKFPDSVTSVGESVLSSARNLTEVKIGKGVTELTTPFLMSGSLKKIEVSEDNTAFTLANGALITKDGKNLVVYPAAKTDSSYTIPSGVVNILESAFASAVNLKNVDFSNSTVLKNIGKSAFENTSIEKLELPDSVEVIDDSAFRDCNKLTEVKLNKVKEIKGYVFQNTGISNLDLGDSLTSVGDSAFADCNALETINLPDSLKTIGSQIFSNSENIRSVHVGASLVGLDGRSFTGASRISEITVSKDNKELKSVNNVLMSLDGKQLLLYPAGKTDTVYVVESGVESIGDFAFHRAEALKEVILPEGVKNIGTSAFNNCISLENIKIPDSMETIGMFAFTGTNLESIYLGKKLKVLDDSALGLIDHMKHIVITGAENLTFTGTAFSLNELTTVYLGDGVKKIDPYSLQYPSLKTVVLGKDLEEIDPDAFSEGPDITFYTIAGSKADEEVRKYNYGTVRNYTPLTLSTFGIDQERVTEETKLAATASGGIGSNEYRFTAVDKDGNETELQKYSNSNTLTVKVPNDGLKVRVYVRDASYYIVQQDLELKKGEQAEGNFVGKAELRNTDGTSSELQKYFNGSVRVESSKEMVRIGFRLDTKVTEVSYKDSVITADEKGIYWVTAKDWSDIELQITTDQATTAVLKVDYSTLRVLSDIKNLTDLIQKVETLVEEKKALQDAKEIYTRESFSALLQQLKAAKLASENWNITQTEADKAAEDLQLAKDSLQIAVISGRRYTASSSMIQKDGTASMMSPILGKSASLERTEKGTWLITFDIIAGKITDYDISGKNVNAITYKLDGLDKEAEILETNDETGLKRFRIETKDISAPIALDINYYMILPEYPTSNTAYLQIRENTLNPVGIEDITVDKTALMEKISQAKEIDKNKYTDESYAKLEEQIKLAEALQQQKDVTQQQIDMQTAALTKAIDELVEISNGIKDGIYEVTLSMLQIESDKPSSMDGAIERKGHIVVKDGKAILYMSVKDLAGFYSGNYTYTDENGNKVPVDVISEYSIEDAYNDSKTGTDEIMKGHLYPKMISFPINLDSEFMTLNMYVPAMHASPSARLNIDYKTMQQTDDWSMDAKEIIANQDEKVTAGQVLDKIKELKQNQPLIIDVTKGSLEEIGADIFNQVSDKGAKIMIRSGNTVWEFEADGRAQAGLQSPLVKVNEDIPEVIQKLNSSNVDLSKILQISFQHEGVLPKQAKITIRADKLKAGQNVILYYYNRETGLFEKEDTYPVQEDGTVRLNMEHCSDYILSEQELPKQLITGETQETLPAVDKKALSDKIAEAKALKQETFTPQTWRAVSEALKNAETVNADSNAGQQAVDAAVEELTRAMQGLVIVETEVPVEKEPVENTGTPTEESVKTTETSTETTAEKTADSSEKESVKTSDKNQAAFYLEGMAAALILAGIAFARRRRKRS